MFTRSLVGVAAWAGLATTAVAQQPAAQLARPQLAVAQAGYPAPRPQVQPAAPAAQPGPAVAPAPHPAPTPTVPMTPAPVNGPDTTCSPYDGYAADTLCGPAGQFWVTAEWLYWRASGHNVPPLVTTAPAGTPRVTAGALGVDTTTVLFGGAEVNDDWRNGFRYGAGMWLDQSQSLGIEADFFYLGQSRDRFAFASDGTLTLARPFVNALTGAQDTRLAAFPGVVRGSVFGEATSNLAGGGANFVRNFACDPCGRFDLTFGFRYIGLRDEVLVREDLTTLDASAVAAGTRFEVTDRFRTGNHFYGIPVGFNWERRWSHWYLDVRSSLALGWTHTRARIDGATTTTTPAGVASAFAGGLLAQPTNSGDFTDNHFAVASELGVRLGAQVTDRTRAFVGYNVLYVSRVERAADTIDLRVNPNQVAPPQALNGPALPAFVPNRTDFWVQGISLGIEYRF